MVVGMLRVNSREIHVKPPIFRCVSPLPRATKALDAEAAWSSNATAAGVVCSARADLAKTSAPGIWAAALGLLLAIYPLVN